MPADAALTNRSWRERLGRDVVVALSLSNLWFIRLWGEIFAVAGDDAFYSKISNADVIALMLNVGLLAAVFVAAATLARRYGVWGRRTMVTGFVLVLVAQLNQVGPELAPGLLAVIDQWRLGNYLEVTVTVGLLALIAYGSYRHPARALRLTVGVVGFLSPFVLVTYARAAHVLVTRHPTDALDDDAPPLPDSLPRTAGPRVVLIVLDAVGRRHAVDARPRSLRLPALDRLRSEGLDASQVTQAGHETKVAIPVLLSGLDVQSAEPSGADELTLTLRDSSEVDWDEADNLFVAAKRVGGVAVAVGWYLPYGRMFPALDGCASYPARMVGSRARDTGFWRALLDQQLALTPFVSLRLRHREVVTSQRAELLHAATLGGRGFVLLHVIAPHTPWIWDAEESAYTLTEFSADGFFGNIALADRILGDMRSATERAGTWDSTAVIVTADHVAQFRPRWLREPRDTRVPLIVKLPGAPAAHVTYSAPLRAQVVNGLSRALLRGQIGDYAALTRWLDARSRG